MTPDRDAFEEYRREVVDLANSESTTEESYYGPIRELLIEVLDELELPTNVRTGTSENRSGSGTDRPDVALYDGEGDFAVVCGEVKLLDQTLEEMATSTARNNQIGRYLAQTGVVLLSNIRGFGLLVPDGDWDSAEPVPPDRRHLINRAQLWSNAQVARDGEEIRSNAQAELKELLEHAVTSFAPIAEPETLARILALQARRAKDNFPDEFGDAVRALIDDFGEALGITFEGEDGEAFFRSSLVQTVFYGLFAGWLLWAQEKTDEEFEWENIPDYLAIPFLGDLFYELKHPQRISELGLAPRLDVAEDTLSRVDQKRFFDKLSVPSLGEEEEDPERAAASAIIYFYEPFLAAFDPDLRKELGVWYTPPEIVKYQVARVDRLLRDKLDCERGLADDRVVVLDPGCGTGAYLIEVLTRIAKQLRSEGVEAELGASLLRAVQNRVLGFEILTAPFVIAHLQIHLILSGLGAEPGRDERPGIYLTNALTGWGDEETPDLHFPELADEHDLAHRVKQEVPIIVVLGNPPYNRFAGAPIEEERELADHYKGITRDDDGNQQGATELYSRFGIQKHLLDDLYVRFFRIAERQIGEEARHGIISYISNNSYLDGRSHPLMRESLLDTFHEIWVDNLHGNRLASERTPWGDACQTVFQTQTGSPGIRVGTSISTFVKHDEDGTSPEVTPIHIRDFWGEADKKREALLAALDMDSWDEDQIEEAADKPAGPRVYDEFTSSERHNWKFIPYGATGGYEGWYALDGLFPVSFQGVNPNRGLSGSVIGMQREDLEDRMRDYFSDQMSFEDLKKEHPELCEDRARYTPKATRSLLKQQGGYDDSKIVPYVLFPLDQRYLYYETRDKLLNESRPDLKANLHEDNSFLLAVPQPRRASESVPLFGTTPYDLHVHDRGTVGLPARIYQEPDQSELFEASESGPRANLNADFWQRISEEWDLRGDLHSPTALELSDELIRVCLALGQAPRYQEKHRDSLAQDWARVPLPKNRELFDELADIGATLGALLDPSDNVRRTLQEILGNDVVSQLGQLRREGEGAISEDDLTVEISYYGSATGRWEERTWGEGEEELPVLGSHTGDLYINDEVYFSNVPKKVWEMEYGGYPVIAKWLGYRHERYRGGKPLKLSEKDTLREIIQRLAAIVSLQPQLDDLYVRAASDPWTLPEE